MVLAIKLIKVMYPIFSNPWKSHIGVMACPQRIPIPNTYNSMLLVRLGMSRATEIITMLVINANINRVTVIFARISDIFNLSSRFMEISFVAEKSNPKFTSNRQ